MDYYYNYYNYYVDDDDVVDDDVVVDVVDAAEESQLKLFPNLFHLLVVNVEVKQMMEEAVVVDSDFDQEDVSEMTKRT